MKTKFKITGAVFDLDGTLLDSMYVWDTLGEKYLISQGIKPAYDINSSLKNLSLRQSADYFRDKYNIPYSPERIITDINKMIEKFYLYEVCEKDGVGDFLKLLAQKGVKMCVATATERYLAENALKRCGLLDYFCGIMTCSEVRAGKDEPDIYLKALEILNTDKETTFIFEDALYAAKTAHNAGFKVCGVYDNYENDTSELINNSDVYIKSFMEAGDFFD